MHITIKLGDLIKIPFNQIWNKVLDVNLTEKKCWVRDPEDGKHYSVDFEDIIEIKSSNTDVVQSSNHFSEHQIETFYRTKDDVNKMIGERRKLIVLHQMGEDKHALIGQLKTLIHGLETNFEGFAQ